MGNDHRNEHLLLFWKLGSVQLSLVARSCPAHWDPMNCSMPGLPVHHQLPEFTQTHGHWVGDAIQPFHPLSSPSSPAFNLSQHQGLFKWVSSSYQMAKYWSFSFNISPSNEHLLWGVHEPMNWSPLGWTGWISLQSERLSRVFSDTTVWKCPFLGT